MKDFNCYWPEIKDGNLLGVKKANILFKELVKTEKLDGNLCEIGCYKGHTSKLMNLVFPEKELEIYDTFEGIRGSDETIDKHKNGEFSQPLKEVKQYVGEKNIRYFSGFFPDSYDKTSTTKYSFVHSDTDTYIGAKSTLEVMWPRMLVGGIIVLDDYNWEYCPGIKKAVHEWLCIVKSITIRRYPFQIALAKTEYSASTS